MPPGVEHRRQPIRGRLEGLAARNGGRAGFAALVVILLARRRRCGSATPGDPFEPQVLDARAYARIARSIERGRLVRPARRTSPRPRSSPASNYSPGLPLLVGGLYRVSGGVDARLARVALALVASLSVLFAYLIGRRLAGPAAGLIAAAAVAVYPALLEYGGMLMTEPLGATLLSGSALAMMRAAERPGAARWLGPGLLLGATAMVRPEYLAIAVLLALLLFARSLRPQGAGQGAVAGRRPAGRGRDRRRALDDPQPGRPRPLRADLHRRRPGAVRRHLPALRGRPAQGRRGGARAQPLGPPRAPGRRPRPPRRGRPLAFCSHSRSRHREQRPPGALAADGRTRKRRRSSGSSRRWPPSATPASTATSPWRRMGRDQLWHDISEAPVALRRVPRQQAQPALAARPPQRHARARLGPAPLPADRVRRDRPGGADRGAGAARRC